MRRESIIVILVIVSLFVVALYSLGRHDYSQNDPSRQNNIDSLKVVILDRDLISSMSNKDLETLNIFKELLKSSGASRDSLLTKFFNESLSKRLDHIKSIVSTKNTQINDWRSNYYKSQDSTLNVGLILLIVLISGVLGGFARTRYGALDELQSAVSAVTSQAEKVKSAITSFNIGPSNPSTPQAIELDSLKNEIDNLKTKLQEIENSDTERTVTNVIFGIIASAMSFLALTSFNSKVLEFNTEIDYFIFLGWCLLGAVFAKNWIKSIYNRMTATNS